MSQIPTDSDGAFDIKRIKRLIRLMNHHQLGELDLRQGEMRIRLRRNVPSGGANMGFMPQPMAMPLATASAATTAPSKEEDPSIAVIKSVMVGTFYMSPSPDAPPFIKVGDHVNPDTTVCIIEAMKVFNEIPAGVSGKIVSVIVENGDPVEYGQPLFRVDCSR